MGLPPTRNSEYASKHRDSRFACDGKHFRILDGGRDFQPVAHNPGVSESRCCTSRRNARSFSGERCQTAAVILALLQDRAPAQPGLRAFQNEKLERLPVVMRNAPPLFVGVRLCSLTRGPADNGMDHAACDDRLQVKQQLAPLSDSFLPEQVLARPWRWPARGRRR